MAAMRAAANNGASRGEKMTSHEFRLNRELLKEAATLKRLGHFENINERCSSKKITSYED